MTMDSYVAWKEMMYMYGFNLVTLSESKQKGPRPKRDRPKNNKYDSHGFERQNSDYFEDYVFDLNSFDRMNVRSLLKDNGSRLYEIQ